MQNDSISFTILFERIAPDSEAEAQASVREAINESALIAGFNTDIEVGFEQRAPILPAIIAIVAVCKLPFKDVPDVVERMKQFYDYLRSKLSRQVQVREIKIKTEHGEYLIKTDDPVKIETPDFAMILKRRE
ncbi:MAG TPA: hypothetical protein VF658_20965 [Pyrinomonadaceae bacterium]|jgi:DNA-directed RNA polymerase beta' subunit